MDSIFKLPKVNLRALNVTCYTFGAGALGFFMRWIQRQMAFDENGLVTPSVWNILLPFYMVIAVYLSQNYLRNLHKDGYSVSEDFSEALGNKSTLAKLLRWCFGIMLSLGALVLLMTCETDPCASLLRIVSVLGIISGISFPLMLESAGKEKPKYKLCCLYSIIPMLMYCVWLLATYKTNNINPVVWAYSMELLTVCVCICAFFRIAGFVYATPRGNGTLYIIMAAIFMCFLSMADSRHLGMQIILIATACMMGLCLWILTENLKFTPPEEKKDDFGGFEDLSGVSRKKKRKKLF